MKFYVMYIIVGICIIEEPNGIATIIEVQKNILIKPLILLGVIVTHDLWKFPMRLI